MTDLATHAIAAAIGYLVGRKRAGSRSTEPVRTRPAPDAETPDDSGPPGSLDRRSRWVREAGDLAEDAAIVAVGIAGVDVVESY